MTSSRGHDSCPGPFTNRYGILVPAIGSILLALFAWFYMTQNPLYTRLLDYWMDAPFEYPFLDLEYVPANIACWHQGIDVYARTPCDVLGRVFTYSPLWLRLSFIPTDRMWTPWFGLGLVSLFLLALGVLPQPSNRSDRALVVLGTFSCLPVFAIERGNMDLIIFLLATVAALGLSRGLVPRVVGYTVLMVAGLLKFYPLAALGLLLHERLWVATLLGVIALVVVAAFAWQYADELTRMAHNIPHGGTFYDTWGALDLKLGISVALTPILTAMKLSRSESAIISQIAEKVVQPLLTVAAIGSATAIAMRQDVRAAIDTLPRRAHVFLLIGAVLVCGCFFAGQSIGYRGVLLLFVLPCLLGLARISTGTGATWMFRLTACATIFVLWMLLIQRAVAYVFGGSFSPVSGSTVGYAVWVLRELIWWWVITVLLAVLLRFGLDSPAWHDLRQVLERTFKLPQPPISQRDPARTAMPRAPTATRG
jgi:hypothetical protein